MRYLFFEKDTNKYVRFYLLKKTKDKNLYTSFSQQHRRQLIPYCFTILHAENIHNIYTKFQKVRL